LQREILPMSLIFKRFRRGCIACMLVCVSCKQMRGLDGVRSARNDWHLPIFAFMYISDRAIAEASQRHRRERAREQGQSEEIAGPVSPNRVKNGAFLYMKNRVIADDFLDIKKKKARCS
jgi:hypothetical protein